MGGSLDNRLRLLIEVIERIRGAVGGDFVVGMQLVGDEFTPHGITLGESKKIAAAVEANTPVDYIFVKAGTFYASNYIVPDMTHPHGVFLPLATGIRLSVKKVPVFAVGRILDAHMAEKVLADGIADMVVMTRAYIADPEIMTKFKEGRLDDIRECIGRNQGCIDMVYKQRHVSCIHNPAAGDELTLDIGTLKQAEKRKKVLVVGGGPAGMKAAEIVARRGHEVVLIEKGDALGGRVAIAAKIPLRKEFGGIIRYLNSQIKKLPVDVRLNTDASVESVLAMNPDAVVVATGTYPQRLGYQNIRPDITFHPGIDQPKVMPIEDAVLNLERVGNSVLLVDDGESTWPLMGPAVMFAEQGKQVEIITTLFYPGAKIGGKSIGKLLAQLFSLGVKITPLTGFRGTNGNTVTLFHAFTGQGHTEDYVTIVLAFFPNANEDLYFGLKGKVKELVRVGDCLAPRDAQWAIPEGEIAARAL